MGARYVVGAAMAAWVMVGCGAEVQETPATPTLAVSVAALTTPNGPTLNGRNVNGRNVNGPELAGRMLVSVRYEGARREGMSAYMDEVWLEASTFHGVVGGEALSGMDFEKVRLIANMDDGSTLPLRIDSITPGSGVDSDVWSYRVSYQEPMTGQWFPVCTAADGTPLNAIPLQGRWDYRQGVEGGGAKIDDPAAFTFACEGAALAKCVRFGYKPWASLNGVSMAEHHQACTRLVRADYCGNGTSYTVDGNWVNLYDSANVQVDTELWSTEAEWTPEGARCFTSHTRATEPVQCGERQVSTCGLGFSLGTLLISETPPAQP